jgi:hypothetical protein
MTVTGDLCYTPIRRRYFGLAPSNSRLSSERLREDFINWYMNVYLRQQEDFLWQQVGRLMLSMMVGSDMG